MIDWLKPKWCDWFHGGGFILRDCYGRINWRCASCGRWSTPVDKQTEKIIIDAALKDKTMTKDNSTGKGLGFFAAGKARFDSIPPFTESKPQSPKPPEPAAWGLERNGQIIDCITPADHDRLEGGYTIPLYRRP